MKLSIFIVFILVLLVSLLVISNSRRIAKLETIQVHGPSDVDYIEIIYGGIDEFIHVGQKVTLLNHPKYKGLVGKPMTIIAVNKPFVAIRWQTILGNDVTDNIDLRECELIPITENYFLANRIEISRIFPEWIDEKGWGYYDFRVQYTMPGGHDPNDSR